MEQVGRKGKLGERMAREFLERKGYVFRESNYWCRMGEIDLVMEDRGTLVMIEVKTRAETTYGQGVDVVAWEKQKKLIRAAKQYQQERGYWGDIRFDVVAIEMGDEEEPRIDHVEWAFGE